MRNSVSKLHRLIKYHFASFLTERHFLKVFLLQLQLNERFYGSKAFEEFRKYFSLIEDVVEEGKTAGVFQSAVNARVFRNVLLGAFSHMALRWLILGESTDTDRMEEINQLTELLTSAVTVPSAREHPS